MFSVIEREGPVTVGEIALSLGIAQPGVTRSLAQLEARGLVMALRSETDQRVKRVALTEQGRQVSDHAKREMWPVVTPAVADTVTAWMARSWNN